jgi:hypothetical protein
MAATITAIFDRLPTTIFFSFMRLAVGSFCRRIKLALVSIDPCRIGAGAAATGGLTSLNEVEGL